MHRTQARNGAQQPKGLRCPYDASNAIKPHTLLKVPPWQFPLQAAGPSEGAPAAPHRGGSRPPVPRGAGASQELDSRAVRTFTDMGAEGLPRGSPLATRRPPTRPPKSPPSPRARAGRSDRRRQRSRRRRTVPSLTVGSGRPFSGQVGERRGSDV